MPVPAHNKPPRGQPHTRCVTHNRAYLHTITRTQEPAWHRRLQAKRAAARTLLRVVDSRHLLANHHSAQHGSTMAPDAAAPVGSNGWRSARPSRKMFSPPLYCQGKGGTCTGTIPTHTAVAHMQRGYPAECRVCHKVYRIPPGAERTYGNKNLSQPKAAAEQELKKIKQDNARLAKENANLKKTKWPFSY